MTGTISLSYEQTQTIAEIAENPADGLVVTVVIHPAEVLQGPVLVQFHRAKMNSFECLIDREGREV